MVLSSAEVQRLRGCLLSITMWSTESIFYQRNTSKAGLLLASAYCFCEWGEAQVGFLIITTNGFLCGTTCIVEELCVRRKGGVHPPKGPFVSSLSSFAGCFFPWAPAGRAETQTAAPGIAAVSHSPSPAFPCSHCCSSEIGCVCK